RTRLVRDQTLLQAPVTWMSVDPHARHGEDVREGAAGRGNRMGTCVAPMLLTRYGQPIELRQLSEPTPIHSVAVPVPPARSFSEPCGRQRHYRSYSTDSGSCSRRRSRGPLRNFRIRPYGDWPNAPVHVRG